MGGQSHAAQAQLNVVIGQRTYIAFPRWIHHHFLQSIQAYRSKCADPSFRARPKPLVASIQLRLYVFRVRPRTGEHTLRHGEVYPVNISLSDIVLPTHTPVVVDSDVTDIR